MFDLCIENSLKINYMKANLGNTDRVVRLLLAALVGILYFTNIISGTMAIVLLLVAGILIITSFVKFCPLYIPFGLSTKKSE
jgi:hypothetical protein